MSRFKVRRLASAVNDDDIDTLAPSLVIETTFLKNKK